MFCLKHLVILSSIFFGLHAAGQVKLEVHADKPAAAIPPTMWGVFFEDINFGADGGLYAELVKNRSFEFPMPMMGWKEVRQQANGKALIINLGEAKPQNPKYAQVTVQTTSQPYALINEGFRGMGIHKNDTYEFSIVTRKKEGFVKLKVDLVSALGKVIASGIVPDATTTWQKHSVSFTTTDSAEKGKLHLYFEGHGTVDVDMISLFPQKTWKNRPNGMRADLVQLLADLKPGFVRFPGGCIVEGRDLDNRYQWKTTVGPYEDRKLIMNRWNVEFPRRAAPDYYQTFGLGFFEYFQLSEDLGAEPLPIINCGMSCQFNASEVVPIDALDPYIQDALDLIEFANGAPTTKWGKVRSEMGHPAPFNLKYLGVGNEQWDEQYLERYKEFEKVLKQRYPRIKLVAAAGPAPDGPRFEYAWKELRLLKTDLVDEHYYQAPEWFLKNAGRYDAYERKGPKIFAGEYAAHGKDDPRPESKNTWISALSEAAFMTGLERNADIIEMASYAPLLAHVDAWQWRPDLIWFDNLRSVGTPNYYVQKMFSNNRGSHVIRVMHQDLPLTGQDSIYASAVIDKKTNEVIIKLVNVANELKDIELDVKGAKLKQRIVNMQILYSPDLMAINTIAQPETIIPVNKQLELKNNKVRISVYPQSLFVIRIPLNQK